MCCSKKNYVNWFKKRALFYLKINFTGFDRNAHWTQNTNPMFVDPNTDSKCLIGISAQDYVSGDYAKLQNSVIGADAEGKLAVFVEYTSPVTINEVCILVKTILSSPIMYY